MMKILLIDEDHGLTEALEIGLRLYWEGAEVMSAEDAATGVRLFATESPDMTLLDVNIPAFDGWEALRRMRLISSAPLIILTALGAEMDKIRGLSLGADDYLTKPFGHLELFARITAVRRRRSGLTMMRAQFSSGDLMMDLGSREVSVGGLPLKLTGKEYKLLALLVRNAGKIMSRETLLTKVWGAEYNTHIGYLKTYVSRLRVKLGDSRDHPQYIVTERGMGYRFLQPEVVAAPNVI